MRLEWEAIHVNYSYLLDQMAPDEVLPHLAVRRLLTPEEVKEVRGKTSQHQKTIAILRALDGHRVVGKLPTFCAALASTAGQEYIAEKLTHCECVIYPMPTMIKPYIYCILQATEYDCMCLHFQSVHLLMHYSSRVSLPAQRRRPTCHILPAFQ